MARDAGSRAGGPPSAALLRALPSVEELAGRLDGIPRSRAVAAARAAIAARRDALLGAEGNGPGEPAGDGVMADGEVTADGGGSADGEVSAAGELSNLERDARALAATASRPRLRPVLNATGVVVHTNLGRAPLAAAAIDAIGAVASGYSNLEYELGSGERGSRHSHVASLLGELTGAEAALVVNNCAGATLLAVAAVASGREVVVSRGQLVEIGGSYRVPEVVAQSGARLVEVGTTNRTRIGDYERALGPDTGALMRVHQSNFRTVGFVEEVEIEELCELGRCAGVPVIDDAGSGALVEGVAILGDEPAVRRSVAAGCAVVCFSGDKLLGGPQAGVMVGGAEAIERCRRHPLARALRAGKLSLAALEATLRLHLEPERAMREIPVLAMLAAGEAELRARAELMARALAEAGVAVEVIEASSRAGGGSLPLLELRGPVCAVDPAPLALDELARRLRAGDPPVIARAQRGRLLLDPRTLDDVAARAVATRVADALA